MSYNKSPEVVARWRLVLDQLRVGQPIAVEGLSAETLRYRLHEAIRAARHNGIEPYAHYQFKFVVRDNVLVPLPKDQELIISLRSTPLSEKPEIHPECRTHFDVVFAAGASGARILKFPTFTGDVNKVRSWAVANNFTVDESPLTLTRS